MSVSHGDILHMVIEGKLADGSIWQNRHRWQVDAPAGLTDAVVLNAAKTFTENLYAYIASQVPGTAALQDGSVDVIAWNPTDSKWEIIQNVGLFSPLDTFANASDELPNQCSAFVIGNTSRPKSKGRMFAPPFGEDTQDHGILTSTALTAMGLYAAQYIINQAVGSDWLMGGIVREAVNQWLGFQSVTYGDVIGTQRRRRLGVGV